LGIAMLLGVIVSAVVAALRQLPQKERIKMARLVDALLRPNTFIAILVSPIAFYGMLVGLGDGRLEPLVYFAAFQNGFFWQTALIPARGGA
jgi:hypothetical protein